MTQMLSGLDVELVKQNWVEELRRSRYGEARIHKAIDNMLRAHPSWPPAIGEFLALCEAAASEMPRAVESFPQIAGPVVTPEQVAEAKDKIAKFALHQRVDREWPNRILARQAAGEIISPTVIRMAKDGKDALRV
jgi:hypothetical protein